MKPPYPQKLDSEPNPVSSANKVPQATSMRCRFQFTMRPRMDAGRYLMLMRLYHAKGRHKRFAALALMANHNGQFASK